jgi:hypothetical protein
MLNCKQGDLAVVVKSTAGNEGKIVRCVRMHDSETHDLDGWPTFSSGPRWVIDRPLHGLAGRPIYTCPDRFLRPLKDSDGEDEVLRLVGRPLDEPQAA